jgi:hypothetical protein
MKKQRTRQESLKPRLPFFFFGEEARRGLEELLPSSVIEEIEQGVERYVYTPWLLRLSRREIVSLKRSSDSLVQKLRALRTVGFYWSEGITLAIGLGRDPSWDVKLRAGSEIIEASHRTQVVSPRPPAQGAHGIPIQDGDRMLWVSAPTEALETFSKDLSWLLNEISFPGGRPAEADRDKQVLTIARILKLHGTKLTKTNSGLFAKVLRIVLEEAGYGAPEDLRPVVAAAVDHLRREMQ